MLLSLLCILGRRYNLPTLLKDLPWTPIWGFPHQFLKLNFSKDMKIFSKWKVASMILGRRVETMITLLLAYSALYYTWRLPKQKYLIKVYGLIVTELCILEKLSFKNFDVMYIGIGQFWCIHWASKREKGQLFLLIIIEGGSRLRGG